MSQLRDLPFFSIVVVLTEKNSYLLPFTLDSIAHLEDGSSFEVVVVDGTRGAALDNLPLEGVRIVKKQGLTVPEMMNAALKKSQGDYVHFLFPGEFYTSDEALTFMRKMIQGYEFPEMIQTPRRVRHQFGLPTIDLFPLSTKILKRGDVPWSLQSYFFRRETLLMMGGFSKEYEIAWGYDLLCRLFLVPILRTVFVRRVLTDYEYRRAGREWIWKQSKEMARVAYVNFGLTWNLFAWVIKNCLRVIRFSWKIIRASFGKNYAET